MDSAWPLVVVAAVVVGAAVGAAVMMVRTQQGEESQSFVARPETRAWMWTVVASCGLHVGAAAALWPDWHEVLFEQPPLVQAGAAAVVLVLFVLSWVVPEVEARKWERPPSPLHRHKTRLVLLYLIAVPALGMAMTGMVVAAVQAQISVSPQERPLANAEPVVLAALDLRRQLRLYLATSAVLIVATLVATAMLRRARLAFSPQLKPNLPASDLIYYGGFFSLLLAVVYLPAFAAVQQAGWHLANRMLTEDPAVPPAGDWFDMRENLIGALSLEIGATKTFASAFAILTPIASAYLTKVLSGDREGADGAQGAGGGVSGAAATASTGAGQPDQP